MRQRHSTFFKEWCRAWNGSWCIGAGRGASRRAELRQRNRAAAAGILRERPVLVFLTATSIWRRLCHTSLYQPLVHDLPDFRLNRVTFETSDSSGPGSATKPQKKSFTLDPSQITFGQSLQANCSRMLSRAMCRSASACKKLSRPFQGLVKQGACRALVQQYA